MNRQEIGSMTAKGGFINEADICKKFSNYKYDLDVQQWLNTMGYALKNIEELNAIQIPVRINYEKAISLGVSPEKFEETIRFKKADIQVKVEIIINKTLYVENISLKKANKSAGFNQVDKRPVLTYSDIWNMDDNITKWLRIFTGDILPFEFLPKEGLNNIRDQRRLFLDEIPKEKLKDIIIFFESNKTLIISDILRGRGGLSAEWFLVTRKINEDTVDWVLKDINTVCNFYAKVA